MVPRRAGAGTHESRSFRDRLEDAARAAGRALTREESAALTAHHALLRHWGRRMNLTAIKDDGDLIKRHFLEPIAAADLLGDEGTLVDLGSGNGFPAIPLKVLHPGLGLVMVEASERKSAFLLAVARELGLRGVRVETRHVAGRRDLRDLIPCRYLTFRGVRGIDLLKGGGEPLLEPEGRALFFVSLEDAETIRARPPAGLAWSESRPLPSGPRSVLAVLTPDALTGAR